MTDRLPNLVIGAGVVGAGVAYALGKRGHHVFVVDKGPRAGTGTTSRNSGVIHAGLYYPSDSLKMKLCVQGKQQLYAFAAQHGVPHARTGKYIVANTQQEIDHLLWLKHNAGDVPLEWVADIPNGIRAKKALYSPTTGIVDIHLFVDALLAHSGADVVFHQDVTQIEASHDHVAVTINGERLAADRVFNCAGLHATDFLPDYHTHYARGAYFQIRLPSDRDVPHLVYPAVPKGSAGLGVHLTRNIHGEAYLGPDVEWIQEERYLVDESRRESFYTAARAYLPWLQPEDLQPGYAGIRPKLTTQGFFDFTFITQGPLVHCLGIESPGITAAMAIGEHVADLLGG